MTSKVATVGFLKASVEMGTKCQRYWGGGLFYKIMMFVQLPKRLYILLWHLQYCHAVEGNQGFLIVSAWQMLTLYKYGENLRFCLLRGFFFPD